MDILENYEELVEYSKRIADELVEEFGKGDWQKGQIFIYENAEEFAHHELTEGWYADSFGRNDYNGAPDPLDFINLEALGERLVQSWDDTNYTLLNDGRIIETPYGW